MRCYQRAIPLRKYENTRCCRLLGAWLHSVDALRIEIKCAADRVRPRAFRVVPLCCWDQLYSKIQKRRPTALF